MAELRDKLDALNREEQEYWEVLPKSYRTPRTLEEREVTRRIPLLRDPLNIEIQLSPEAALPDSSNERTFGVIIEEQDHEIIPQDDASLPEIPDSTSFAASTLPIGFPPIPIPPIFDTTQSSLRLNSEDLHWRLSTTSNNTNSRSSATESSIVGPSTPINMVHDILLPTIISSDMLEEETESIGVKAGASHLASDTQEQGNQDGERAPTEQSHTVFRDSFTFPSFTIPPLATPLPPSPERDETFLAPSESAFTLVSHSAATVIVMPPPETTVVADENRSDPGNARRFKKLSRMFLNPLVVSTAPVEPKADDLHGEEGQAGASSILRSLLVPRRRTKSTTMPRGSHS